MFQQSAGPSRSKRVSAKWWCQVFRGECTSHRTSFHYNIWLNKNTYAGNNNDTMNFVLLKLINGN